MKIDKTQIPSFVLYVSQALEEAGFLSYLVGGCVRDLMLHVKPKDYDFTTNATPEQIIGIFDKTVYENVFGTVIVINEETGEQIEVTPFRKEGKYTDKRHPDNVIFSDKIDEDLMRRDFTVNAMAYRLVNDELVDLWEGEQDINKKLIRTVGNPDERFAEDPLRLMRAVRFSCSTGFTIEAETMNSIFKNAELIKHISLERVRDEFVKIIESSTPSVGVEMLRRLGLLEYFIPELLEGVGCEQGGAHIYDVYEHLLHALQHAADKNFSANIRLAALFHDIGKPKSRRFGEKKAYTFYGHEVIGAKMTKVIMQRLKFSKDDIDFVSMMVRQHMFFSDTEIITLSPVRRVIRAVGADHIWDLMNIRECDRVGMKKKEAPYRLRKYFAMIEEALHDPISVGQLAVDGNILMKELGVKPGPRMGYMLHALLEEVLEDPNKNTREYLDSRVVELDKLSDAKLKALGDAGKEKKEELESLEVSKLHKKHGV